TFINSERRFGHVKKVSRAPGQALSDFNIFRLVAEYWGCAGLFSEWTSPQAVFQILKRLSAGLPCDITGVEDYRDLDANGGIQWPWSAAMKTANAGAAPIPERRRQIFHGGRAREVFVRSAAPGGRAGGSRISLCFVVRPRHQRAVAHEHAHGKVSRAAHALSGKCVRGNQSHRCGQARACYEWSGGDRFAARAH